MRSFDIKALRRRTVEIDYRHKHRHLPGSLSALGIIADIYRFFDFASDVFILSKGHACAAHYAVLEACGRHPDVSKVHPERDDANGVTITSGSLGHGLPIAVGIALAKKALGGSGTVHVLMGDGEAQEGTTWESLNLAQRFDLDDRLVVHLDANSYQGSEGCLVWNTGRKMNALFPVQVHGTIKGEGVAMFAAHPEQSVHLVTEAEFAAIMEELA